MKQIEDLLRQLIGLDAASIGSALIAGVVRLRMKELGLTRVDDYHRVLQFSPREWNELVESVVVKETWFFRDHEPFSAFVRLVQSEWLPAHPAGALQVLSVPCASGEEPYSLAMALREAGLPPERFAIEGIDISCHALERAEHGVYRKRSFREQDIAFRDRYFREVEGGYLLDAAIREKVCFHPANLLGDDFTTRRAAYDFIFCRNLLIYFDRATHRRAFDRLNDLLAPAGALFVGPAEMPLAIENGFVSAELPMAFACRKPVPAGRIAGTGECTGTRSTAA